MRISSEEQIAGRKRQEKRLLTEHADRCLDGGSKYPFAVPKDVADQNDWAYKAALGICYDLRERVGIKNALDEVAPSTRNEIVTVIHKIIQQAHKAAPIDQSMAVGPITPGYWYVKYGPDPGYFVVRVIQCSDIPPEGFEEGELAVWMVDREGPCSIGDIGADNFIHKLQGPYK